MFLSLILMASLCLSLPLNHLYADFSEAPENEKKDEQKMFQNLKEAEKYLESLLKQKERLSGDWWGINITAYRYSLVFYPRGYIAYRIHKIEEEIKKTGSSPI